MSDTRAGPWSLPITRVANVHLVNQVAGFAPDAAVSNLTAGLYRVSIAIAITTAGTAGTLTASAVSQGDGGLTQTQSLAAIRVDTLGDLAQDSFVCEAKAASSISIGVVAAGLTAGALKYSMRVVIEQLSVLP